MRGYLRVRSIAGIERDIVALHRHGYSKAEFVLDLAASPEAMGWIPLLAAIKQGTLLKLSASQHSTHYEARLDMVALAPRPASGAYEIRGGPLAGVGTFVDVASVPGNAGSKMFFVCHSSSGDGRSLLQWEIAAMDLVDADSPTSLD